MNANDDSMTITASRPFAELVSGSMSDRDSLVCVGLDPELTSMPESVIAGHSPGEAIVAFNRALVLCKELGSAPQILGILNGLVGAHLMSGKIQKARAVALAKV